MCVYLIYDLLCITDRSYLGGFTHGVLSGFTVGVLAI